MFDAAIDVIRTGLIYIVCLVGAGLAAYVVVRLATRGFLDGLRKTTEKEDDHEER